nr:hypothetical protein Iba_chr10fCG10170 [Ipomoea batatas]
MCENLNFTLPGKIPLLLQAHRRSPGSRGTSPHNVSRRSKAVRNKIAKMLEKMTDYNTLSLQPPCPSTPSLQPPTMTNRLKTSETTRRRNSEKKRDAQPENGLELAGKMPPIAQAGDNIE